MLKRRLIVARPSKYETHVAPRLEEVKDWVRNGATDKDIWQRLRISEDSFYEYKKRFSEFSESLKENNDFIDGKVESALLKRALGYSYNEVTKEFANGEIKVTKIVTKQVVPDTKAQIFWLKNRRSKQWREKPVQTEDNQEQKLDALIKALNGRSDDGE
ncbi:MAG: hypothetical protein K2H78_03025, partial [Clostridia bacterium]|nr:hypothetical protein [Clostridia bacterium]